MKESIIGKWGGLAGCHFSIHSMKLVSERAQRWHNTPLRPQQPDYEDAAAHREASTCKLTMGFAASVNHRSGSGQNGVQCQGRANQRRIHRRCLSKNQEREADECHPRHLQDKTPMVAATLAAATNCDTVRVGSCALHGQPPSITRRSGPAPRTLRSTCEPVRARPSKEQLS